MKPERRTLTAAMTPNVTPEVLALIKEGTPKPQAPAIIPVAPAVAKPEEKPSAKVLRVAPAELVKPKVQQDLEREVQANISHTVRLPANFPPALLKVASERKLKKIKPYTQQDIVIEAIREWFKKNGCQI